MATEEKYASNVLPKLVAGEQTVYFMSGGSWCYLRTPASFEPSGEKKQPCVIYTHGSFAFVRENETDFTANPKSPKNPFVNAIIEAGICVAASHASGETWGGPPAVMANAAMVKDLADFTCIDTGALGMWGGGFGGATAINSTLGPLLGKVKGVALTQAVLSYKSVVLQNLQPYKDKMLQAFGMPTEMEKDEAIIAALKPIDPLECAKAQSPEEKVLRPNILVIHGDADDHIVFEDNAARFHEEFGAKSTMLALPGIKHGVMIDSVVKPFQDFWIENVKK